MRVNSDGGRQKKPRSSAGCHNSWRQFSRLNGLSRNAQLRFLPSAGSFVILCHSGASVCHRPSIVPYRQLPSLPGALERNDRHCVRASGHPARTQNELHLHHLRKLEACTTTVKKKKKKNSLTFRLLPNKLANGNFIFSIIMIAYTD